MNRRASKIAGLVASVAALVLAAGMVVPAAADPPQEIESAKPRENAELHRAPENVVVTFSEEAPEDTSITVKACDRTVSGTKTTVSGDQASVNLKGEPQGRYRVTVNYTVVAEPEPSPTDSPSPDPSPSPSPSETPPPDEQSKKWSYSFKVHFGPDCDGPDGNGGNKKKYSWGSTTDSSHHGGDHAASASNPITASSTHSDHTGSPTSPTTYSPSYTPFYNSPSSATDHSTTNHSAIPDFDSGFGDSAFESTTEDSQLSDPTDPSLATPEPGVIAPEEADDERSLSAAPTDTLEPESGVLVVALAAALLLGAGGGLFLRKADPTPARK